jgi:hypothetical protein
VWAPGVVVNPPLFDDDLGFAQRIEDLAVKGFVAQAAVEAYMDPARAQGCKSAGERIRLQSYIRP